MIDQILQQMQELTETVKSHQGDKATLDMDKIKGEMTALIEAQVQAQIAKAAADKPVRPLAGDPIGYAEATGQLTGNRFGRELKAISKDGFAKVGTQRVQPVDFVLANMLLGKASAMMPDRVKAPSADLQMAVKALTSTGSGTGDELVPTNMAAQLWEDIFLASRIAANITTIQMPSNPFDVPLGLGDVTWRKGTENTATTASDAATAKSVLTATELVTEVNWSYTLDEDSIVALMPAVRSRLGISAAEVIDAFMLNADATNAATGNINLDDADPDDASYYLSAGQDGIRHLWLVDNTGQEVNAGGDALGDGDITSALGKMGKYAVNPNEVMMIVDVATYLNGLMALTNVTTVDKFGPQATVLTGQLASYRGIPIVVSASGPLTEADGKKSNTAGNNTLGQISIVNRTMWYAGFRREVLIEVDRDIQKRQWIMVTSVRPAVAAHGTRSTAKHTVGIRNILV